MERSRESRSRQEEHREGLQGGSTRKCGWLKEDTCRYRVLREVSQKQ